MKKYRKIGILLLILLIGIAGWQVYSYIERATRPEPAVVYISQNMMSNNSGTPRTNDFNRIYDFLHKHAPNSASVWAVDSKGKRKWKVKDYGWISGTNMPEIGPLVCLNDGDEKVVLCSDYRNIIKNSAIYSTGLDPITSDYNLCTTHLPRYCLPLIVEKYGSKENGIIWVSDNKSKFKAYFTWDGESDSLKPLDLPVLYEAIKQYDFVDTYITGTEWFIVGREKVTVVSGADTNRCHLLAYDPKADRIVSKYVFPSLCESVFSPPVVYREEEFISAGACGIFTHAYLVRPQNDDRPALLYVYRGIKNPPAMKFEKQHSLMEFDIKTGRFSMVTIPLDLLEWKKEVPICERFSVAGYNYVTDRVYISVPEQNSVRQATLILNPDNTWTKCEYYIDAHFQVTADGAIWYVEYNRFTNNKQYRLFRIDPDTNEREIIHEADVVRIVGTY